MNIFTKWLNKKRRGTSEDKHKTALFIAFILTFVVSYFVLSFWYGRFMRILNTQNPNLNNEVIVEERIEISSLESIKLKIKSFFNSADAVEQ